jgi:hypothetical protein
MRRVLAVVLLAGLAFPIAASAAPTPTPSPALEAARGISVTPQPKSPHRSTSGSFLELGTVQPGVPVLDTVDVRSTFDTPADVDVYPADAEPAVGGGFGFSARTDHPTEVGAWLHLALHRVRVPAQGQVVLHLSVTVPAGTEGGEYVGAVIAEPVNQGPATGVQTRTRFAMSVYLTVPGGARGSTPGRGRPDGTLQVLAVEPHFKGNKACPVVRFRNDSQAIVDPQTTVRTSGLFGSGTSYKETRTGALLPGATADIPLPCVKRPLGPGTLRVVVQSPKGNKNQAFGFTWVPVSLLVALLFLLLLVAALLTTFARGWLRRKDDESSDRAAVRHGS